MEVTAVDKHSSLPTTALNTICLLTQDPEYFNYFLSQLQQNNNLISQQKAKLINSKILTI